MAAQDHVAANALHNRRKLLRARTGFVVVLMVIAYEWFVQASLHRPLPLFVALLVHGVAAAAAAFFLLAHFVLLSNFVRKAYGEQPRLHAVMTVSWVG